MTRLTASGFLLGLLFFSGCLEVPESPEKAAAPELISPQNGATDVLLHGATLSWNAVSTATAYHLQINDTGTFPEFPLEAYTLYEARAQYGSLPANTTFYWRVCYTHGLNNDVSEWSDVYSFTTATLGVPQMLEPADGATVAASEAQLIWVYVPGVNYYEIEVSTSSDFSVITHHGKFIDDTVDAVSNLQNNTEYFWRVRSQHGSEYSGWSEVYRFTVSF